jgi:hypothetical protein
MTYAIAVIAAAHEAVLALLDAAVTPGQIRAYTGAAPATVETAATGTLLGTIILAKPAGEVSPGTGQLIIDHDASTRDESADASGTIGYVRITDGAGVGLIDLPAAAGTEPVSGQAVFNTLTVVAGGPIELASLTLG